MKLFPCSLLLVVSLTLGCAHRPAPPVSVPPSGAASQDRAVASRSGSQQADVPGDAAQDAGAELAGGETAGRGADMPASSREVSKAFAAVQQDSADAGEYGDYVAEGEPEKKAEIADPLEPFNRAMYHFNDKLYFWVLKPVAQGYKKAVPEKARVGVSNFFSNIAFPVRFVNCLLQGNFSGASTELGRFLVNTLWGIGGFLDPASSEDIKLAKQDADLGQTLGIYGVGQGFYIHWPIFGPSSPRDTVGTVGDFFLQPFTYLAPDLDTSAGIRASEKVNATSLSIGDYESLKEAAIDPYVAVRDAYVQYRLKRVNAGRGQPMPAGTGTRHMAPGSEKTLAE